MLCATEGNAATRAHVGLLDTVTVTGDVKILLNFTTGQWVLKMLRLIERVFSFEIGSVCHYVSPRGGQTKFFLSIRHYESKSFC